MLLKKLQHLVCAQLLVAGASTFKFSPIKASVHEWHAVFFNFHKKIAGKLKKIIEEIEWLAGELFPKRAAYAPARRPSYPYPGRRIK